MHPLLALFQVAPEPHAAQEAAGQGFDAGEVILEHVSNSPLAHPLIHLPTIFGIDFSVTKHVFMVWLVAATLFVVVTALVQRYLKQVRLVPNGPMGVLEVGVEFIRDGVVMPNIGTKFGSTWMPLILTLFVFILGANLIGLIPIFDTLALLDHFVLHTGDGSFLQRLI